MSNNEKEGLFLPQIQLPPGFAVLSPKGTRTTFRLTDSEQALRLFSLTRWFPSINRGRAEIYTIFEKKYQLSPCKGELEGVVTEKFLTPPLLITGKLENKNKAKRKESGAIPDPFIYIIVLNRPTVLVFQFSFQELSVQASDMLDRDALRTL